MFKKMTAVTFAAATLCLGSSAFANQPMMQTGAGKLMSLDLDLASTAFGYLRLTAGYRVSPAWIVGLKGGVETWSKKDHEDFRLRYDVGVTASYAFDGDINKDGWLFHPAVSFLSYNEDPIFVNGGWVVQKKSHGVAVSGLFDYQWVSTGGFNVKLGIGPEYYTAKSPLTKVKGVGLGAELLIGYYF